MACASECCRRFRKEPIVFVTKRPRDFAKHVAMLQGVQAFLISEVWGQFACCCHELAAGLSALSFSFRSMGAFVICMRKAAWTLLCGFDREKSCGNEQVGLAGHCSNIARELQKTHLAQHRLCSLSMFLGRSSEEDGGMLPHSWFFVSLTCLLLSCTISVWTNHPPQSMPLHEPTAAVSRGLYQTAVQRKTICRNSLFRTSST